MTAGLLQYLDSVFKTVELKMRKQRSFYPPGLLTLVTSSNGIKIVLISENSVTYTFLKQRLHQALVSYRHNFPVFNK